MMRKPCCNKEETNKGAWSKLEDQLLSDYIRSHGEGRWRSLPKAAGDDDTKVCGMISLQRCGKSCRLRWINYLRPGIKRGNFAPDEEDLIIKLHALLGNRWALIAGRLPGRTDNEVKNYWNSHKRKKLVTIGIDPNNHKLGNFIPQSNQMSSQSTKEEEACNKTKLQRENNTSHGIPAARTTMTDDNESSVEEDETSWNDVVSSSSMEDDGLNLDLTITIPAQEGIEDQDEVRANTEIIIEEEEEVEVEGRTQPTLLLFR